ncbi:MAG: extracellular solute-binding protein [Actinobacteria bacterium]|nr:extracellular solute-binding protein [Actinomycetota bacterium]
MDRRSFLRLAGGAAALATVGCGSGGEKRDTTAATQTSGPGGGKRTLRIVQLSHFIPAYDAWFDNEHVARWGDEHDVTVVVDRIPFNEVNSRAAAEAAAQGPHDIFGFVDAPSPYEDDAIDHTELVAELSGKYGKMIPLVERCVVNPKTGKTFGCPHYWVANATHYRVDLWNQVQAGLVPRTWNDLQTAAAELKALGHPLGIGLSQEGDSNYSLISLLQAYGASLQDEAGRLTINQPATIEAVKAVTALRKAGLSDDVFAWDGSSNNRALLDGRASLILNGVSAIRAIEIEKPELAGNIGLAPFPMVSGGQAQRGVYVVGVNVIWKFSKNQDLARQFLVDLASVQRDAFLHSGFYNIPPFEGARSEIAQLVSHDDAARPPDKYAFLAEAATSWCTNVGHPGPANAACMEVFNQYLVPRMFAAAARGEKTAEEAVRTAEAQMKAIFDKWRERGKI